MPNEVIRIMRQLCEPLCYPCQDFNSGDHTGDRRLQQGRKGERVGNHSPGCHAKEDLHCIWGWTRLDPVSDS